MENSLKGRIRQHIRFDGSSACYNDIKEWISQHGLAVDDITFHRHRMFIPSTYGVETVKTGDMVILNEKNLRGELDFYVLTDSKRLEISIKKVVVPEPAVSLN